MKNIFIYSFLFIVFCWSPVYAQDTTDNPDAVYLAYVDSAADMPADFDFVKARELYSQTSFFKPYEINFKLDFKDFFKRANAGDAKVFPEIQQYARIHFPFVEVHSRSMIAFKKHGQKEKEDYHIWAARGTAKALYGLGDSYSKESALPVLSLSEEYLVARQVGKVIGQRLVHDSGKVYDVLKVTSKDTGDVVDMWFDITNVFNNY